MLRRNLRDAASPARYDWLYLSNPNGPSRVWLAENTNTAEAIGTSAGHPKTLRIAGEERTALNLGDFAVDKAYRSLGPALLLLKATLGAIDAGEFDLAYDHPNAAMAAIYERMGGRVISSRRRWVRLLTATPALQKRLGASKAAIVAGRLGDWLIRTKDVLRRSARLIPVSTVEGGSWPELASPVIRAPVHLVRNTAYLHWRFMQATTHQHGLLYIGETGRAEAYLVFRQENPQTIAVMDMVAAGERVTQALMGSLVDVARRRSASALWATVLAGSPSEAVLARHGFRAQETEPGVCVYAPRMSEAARRSLEDPRCWWTFEGDQDV